MIGAYQATLLANGRRAAEARMLDWFSVERPTGKTTDADGFPVLGREPIEETAGRLAGTSSRGDSGARTMRVGDTERIVVIGGLHLPISALAPKLGGYGIGWEYVLVRPGPDTDPALVGSRWLAVGTSAKSQMTARRLDVVQLDQPQI